MTLKEQLIMAAIDVIEQDGLPGFTMRRVAAVCGVSCAAPYKHFAGKEELFLAVLDYVQGEWQKVQDRIIAENEGDLQEQLVEASLAYIRFLTDNPHLRAVVMLRGSAVPNERQRRAEMSSQTRELVSKWCIKSGYTHEQTVRKTFSVRSIIFGAVMMFESGELEYTDENMAMIEKCIRREFTLE